MARRESRESVVICFLHSLPSEILHRGRRSRRSTNIQMVFLLWLLAGMLVVVGLAGVASPALAGDDPDLPGPASWQPGRTISRASGFSRSQ